MEGIEGQRRKKERVKQLPCIFSFTFKDMAPSLQFSLNEDITEAI